jgi:Fe-S cluster biogenesis protein NfuA
MKEKVQKVIEEIRPSLQADGGDIELVNVTDEGVVQVRLKGACVGCPMAQVTLHQGVGAYLKKAIPEVKEVEAV